VEAEIAAHQPQSFNTEVAEGTEKDQKRFSSPIVACILVFSCPLSSFLCDICVKSFSLVCLAGRTPPNDIGFSYRCKGESTQAGGATMYLICSGDSA
jgi:hypothetical protein